MLPKRLKSMVMSGQTFKEGMRIRKQDVCLPRRINSSSTQLKTWERRNLVTTIILNVIGWTAFFVYLVYWG